MTDRNELRRLAEASFKAEETWHHEADLHGSLACTYGEAGDYYVEQDSAFIAAASPEVVLGLLDEIDGLSLAAKVAEDHAHKFGEERDQLRAVAVRLKGALERLDRKLSSLNYGTSSIVRQVVYVALSDPEVKKL